MDVADAAPPDLVFVAPRMDPLVSSPLSPRRSRCYHSQPAITHVARSTLGLRAFGLKGGGSMLAPDCLFAKIYEFAPQSEPLVLRVILA